MSLSSSSLGPWQPTKNLLDSWGQHPPQPITHFPIKTKRTSLVTREPKFPSPHWFSMRPALLFLTGMEVPHPALFEQLISIRCLVVRPAATRCPSGSGAAPHGSHQAGTAGDVGTCCPQSGSAPLVLQHGCASLLSAGPAVCPPDQGAAGSHCSYPCTTPTPHFSARTLHNPP